ncbi:MAG: MAPEG family protein [Candidatus Omnitrophica bacterium]|nr:MAPEG family protein [Candidatus Omnitrophota bacterium]
MNSYICIAITAVIPLLCAGYAKLSRKGYDNHSPREFLAKTEGKGRRADYAQQNSYEAFPPFAVGVLAAHQMGVPVDTINMLATTFLGMRLIYCVCYIQNWHIMRSIVWFIGFGITIALYFIGL